jgi:hypothetical protein
MPSPKPIDDEVLGRVTWDRRRGYWRFEVALPSGRVVPGTIASLDRSYPLPPPVLEEIRECVRWVRDNEPAVRRHVARELYEGWRNGMYEEEIEYVPPVEQFREAITLVGVNVYEDRKARAVYDAGNLFGGDWIEQAVGRGGAFDGEPELCG